MSCDLNGSTLGQRNYTGGCTILKDWHRQPLRKSN